MLEQEKKEPDTCPPCLASAAAWAPPSTGRQLNVSSGLRKPVCSPLCPVLPSTNLPDTELHLHVCSQAVFLFPRFFVSLCPRTD